MLPDNFDHDVEEAAGNMPAEAGRMPAPQSQTNTPKPRA
jgi:hypothetical protein